MVAGWLGWLLGWLLRLFVGFLFVDDVGRGDCVLAVSFFSLVWEGKRDS